MEKWVRRGLQAAVTAGAVGASAVGVSHADDTTVVAPGVVSKSVSVVGDNSILSGNSLSVPVVVPITDNKVAVTGIGAAVNAEDAVLALGLLGAGYACGGGGDYTEVSPFVKSSSTSVVGDNSILSGNSLSVPVVAPITGNDVAIAGIGAAANVDSLVAALGILGTAHAGECDDGGNGGYPDNGGNGDYPSYPDNGGNGGNGHNGGDPYDPYGYSESGSSDTTVVAGEVISTPTSVVGDNSIGSGNSLSVPVYAPITGNDVAASVVGAAVNADDVVAALGVLGTAHAESGSGDGSGDSTTVAPTVVSAPTSQVGDNSILSGNSLSAPIVAPITDNDVAVAGIGGAVNAEDVAAAAGVLGHATAESGGSGEETVVAPTVVSAPTSQVGDNSIGSGNSLSVPVVAPVTGNDVAVAGIGGAVNADDVSLAAGILGTATALLGN